MSSSSSIAYHDYTSVPKTWNLYQSKFSLAQWFARRFHNLKVRGSIPGQFTTPFCRCPYFATGGQELVVGISSRFWIYSHQRLLCNERRPTAAVRLQEEAVLQIQLGFLFTAPTLGHTVLYLAHQPSAIRKCKNASLRIFLFYPPSLEHLQLFYRWK